MNVGDSLVWINAVDGRFRRARDLPRISGAADDKRGEIHGRLRIGEKDGGLGDVLQLRLAGIGDDAYDFDGLLNVPANAELLAESTLSGIEAVHKRMVDDGDGLGVETVAVIEVAAAH